MTPDPSFFHLLVEDLIIPSEKVNYISGENRPLYHTKGINLSPVAVLTVLIYDTLLYFSEEVGHFLS